METLRPRTEARRHILAYAGFLAVTLIAYYPSLHGTLLWDDEAHVTRPGLRDLHGLWAIWADPKATQQYYPLLNTAFWIEHKVWGDAVLGYHLINVALHALSAYLLVLILRRLSVQGAWLAGALFALHPVCVEAVAWISEQKSTLSGVFYLSAALMYFKFDQSRERRDYGIASLLFACALLSKTVTATLPAALLVMIWWKRGRIDRDRDLRPLSLWLTAGAAAGLTTAWIEKHFVGASGADYSLSIAQRLLLSGRVVWFYFAKLFWPSNLIFIYPHWVIDSRAFWQYGFTFALLAVLIALAAYARKNRAPIAATLFFVGTLFPVLGFLNVFPFLYSYVADHFQYLASLGIIVPAAWFISTRLAVIPARTVASLLMLVLAVLTWRQNHMYTDVQTLYRETIARNPTCWMAHVNLGMELTRTPGHESEAEAHFREALRIKPTDHQAYTNLATLYSSRDGDHRKAVAYLLGAIRIKPDFAEAHFNLGNEYSRLGKSAEALAEYERAVKLSPEFALARTNIGGILIAIPGRREEGIRQLQESIRLAPGLALAHLNLGVALSAIPERSDDAIHELDLARDADPKNPAVHYDLGAILARMPDQSEAAMHEFEETLRIQPAFAEAHVSIANLLLSKPNGRDEAVDEYEAALRTNPNLASAHAGLALALAGIPKRAAEAKEHREIALRLQPGLAKSFRVTTDSVPPN